MDSRNTGPKCSIHRSHASTSPPPLLPKTNELSLQSVGPFSLRALRGRQLHYGPHADGEFPLQPGNRTLEVTNPLRKFSRRARRHRTCLRRRRGARQGPRRRTGHIARHSLPHVACLPSGRRGRPRRVRVVLGLGRKFDPVLKRTERTPHLVVLLVLRPGTLVQLPRPRHPCPRRLPPPFPGAHGVPDVRPRRRLVPASS